MVNKKDDSLFRITKSSGFQIKFKNGYTVSVQFGPGNYCENYDMDWDIPMTATFLESKDAEVAIINKNGELMSIDAWGEDQVAGYYTPKMVLNLLQFVEKLRD